jgi:Fe-S-cluster containining protein
MLAPAVRVPCTQCARCCTYVAVGVDPPRSVRAATDILWYLYHDQVSVYRDGDGDWSVVFETRCRHLQDDLRCGVYERRPHICREFDNTTCEVNTPGGSETFREPAEFVAWLARHRPAVHRRLTPFLPSSAV